MNHTIGRHRRLYSLFRDSGTNKYRHDLVYSFSNGRTDNSTELTDLEVDELITHLQKLTPQGDKITHTGIDYKGQQMRRRILSLCYTIGWVTWNQVQQKHEVDWERLNAWMLKYGYLHKHLNKYTYPELQRLVVQFENMAQEILTPSR